MIKTDEELLLQQIEELESEEKMPELIRLDKAIRITGLRHWSIIK